MKFEPSRLPAVLGLVLVLSASVWALQSATLPVTVTPPRGDDRTLLGYDPARHPGLIGAEGKDVVYLPTSPGVAYAMLQLAGVGPNDTVYDLGSGDGRIPIMAAKHFGARAVGVEFNSELNTAARANARAAGVADKVTFMTQDLFLTDLSPATVITMFLLPDVNEKLRPTLESLKPGTRIVSNTFLIAGWQADKSVVVSGCSSFCRPHLWVVKGQ